MTQQEIKEINERYEELVEGDKKLKIFHDRESGEVIMIVFNPNILGITKLSDFLTLKADHLRNLIFWFKTRDPKMLESMVAVWRDEKGIPLIPVRYVNIADEEIFKN